MSHPKGLLIERLGKLGAGKPEFRTVNTGPDHQPTFLSDVLVDGEVYGTGQGTTKREAERLAAAEALAYLERNPLTLDAQEDDAEEETGPDRFEGPWPMFEELLVSTLEIANARIDMRLAGDEARFAIRDFALELYKDLLQDLGDVVEDDLDEDEVDEDDGEEEEAG